MLFSATCVVKVKIAGMRSYFVLKEQRKRKNYLTFSFLQSISVYKVLRTGDENVSDQIV